MSEIQKCPNLIRGGGGQQFSKMSEIQKSLKFTMGGGGGGGKPIWEFSPNFSMAPLTILSFNPSLTLNIMFHCFRQLSSDLQQEHTVQLYSFI